MKKLVIVVVAFCISCSKPSLSNESETIPPAGSYFLVEQAAGCNGTTVPTINNLSKPTYIKFIDNNDNYVAYQPLPNKWYRLNISGGVFVKMGSDVKPKEYIASANNQYYGPIKNVPYQSPCLP